MEDIFVKILHPNQYKMGQKLESILPIHIVYLISAPETVKPYLFV